jgi:hypothetical protein
VRAHVVLERDRHTGERARIAADRDGVVDLRGAGARLVGEHEVEGVDVALTLVDRGQMALEHVGSADQVVADVPGDVRGAGREFVAHAQSSSPTIGGTRKRPSSAAGASASTSSRSRQSISMSSRITLAIGVGCVIGSTPVEIEGVDVGEVVEHVAQLMGRLLEFVVGQATAERAWPPWQRPLE